MSRMDSGNQGQQGQQDVGQSVGQIKDKAAEVTQNIRDLGSQVRDTAQNQYSQLRDQAQNYYEQGRRKATEWEEGVESYVHEKPLQALLIAAGVGLILGALWKRS